MNWKKIIGIAAGIAIIAIVVIRLKSNKKSTQEKVYHFDKEQAINVKADTLQFEDIGSEFSYSGTFEPKQGNQTECRNSR
jgi:membrane fusion protein (multidrug efflux system)